MGIFGLVYLAYLNMPFGVWIFFYPVPFLIGAFYASFTSMIEHYEMLPGDDAYSSRTYGTTSHLTNFIWNNVSYHNEHHKFPGIPFYNLRSFHEAAYPYYEDRVQQKCFPTIWRLAFSLWGRIFELDIKKVEERYRGIDRQAERERSMGLPGIAVSAGGGAV